MINSNSTEKDIKTYRVRIFYEKKGISRFISHRNFHRHIERTMRRVDLPFKFTEGFNPHPKMSYGPASPVNMSCANEAFEVCTTKKFDEQEFLNSINKILPRGTKFLKIEWVKPETLSLAKSAREAILTVVKTKSVNMQELKEQGTVIEETNDTIIIKSEVCNLTHKKLKDFLCYTFIERKILWQQGTENKL